LGFHPSSIAEAGDAGTSSWPSLAASKKQRNRSTACQIPAAINPRGSLVG